MGYTPSAQLYKTDWFEKQLENQGIKSNPANEYTHKVTLPENYAITKEKTLKETVESPVIEDPNPVIECSKYECGTHWMRRSECKNAICCEIDDEWSLFDDRDKCHQARENYWDAKYNDDDDDDDDDDNDYKYEYTPPPELPSYDTETVAPLIENTYEEEEKDIEECKSDAREFYNQKITYCRQFGGTSAFDACTKVYYDKLNKALSQCE